MKPNSQRAVHLMLFIEELFVETSASKCGRAGQNRDGAAAVSHASLT